MYLFKHSVIKTAITAIMGIAISASMFGLSAQAQELIRKSPDQRFYAKRVLGEKVDKGQERERLVVYDNDGKQKAVAHVWLIEPDGTNRAGIRGCEQWGWVDDTRLFCQGTVNPSTSIYLEFDSKTGRELLERVVEPSIKLPD